MFGMEWYAMVWYRVYIYGGGWYKVYVYTQFSFQYNNPIIFNFIQFCL